MSENVAIIENEGVVEIHLDRPDKKNALTGAMYHAMIAALADASAREAVGGHWTSTILLLEVAAWQLPIW